MDRIKSKLETEKRILSLLINQPELIGEASQLLTVSDFSDNHKEAIQLLFDIDKPDSSTIFLTFKSIQSVDYFELSKETSYFGISSLKKLSNHLFALNESIDLVSLLDNIKNKIQTKLNPVELYAELYSETEKYLNQKSFNDIQTFADALNEVSAEIESELNGKIQPIKSTSFPSFNKLTNGIRKSNLLGIAGSYKSGKSSFITSLLLDFAEQNIPVCLFSLELSKRESVSKLVSYKKSINYNHLIEPSSLTDLEIQELNRLKTNANQLPMYISSDLLSLNQIKAKMKLLRDRKKVEIFFIDYLGYLRSDNNDFNSREREMTFFSVQLKKFAKELNVVIFVVAQLNRTGLNEPSSIHLAESISLARDCDYLFTISTAEALKNHTEFSKVFYGDVEGKFVVRLDTSRHTQQGKAFIIGFLDNKLREIRIDNFYQNKAI